MTRDWIPTGMTQKESVAKALEVGREKGYTVSRRKRGSEVHLTFRMPENWRQRLWYRFLAIIGR